jgi:hypothetical protein
MHSTEGDVWYCPNHCPEERPPIVMKLVDVDWCVVHDSMRPGDYGACDAFDEDTYSACSVRHCYVMLAGGGDRD